MKYAVITLLLLRAAVATSQYSNSEVFIPKEGIPRITRLFTGNQIWASAVDSNNLLYLGSTSGLSIYDGSTEKFVYKKGAIRTLSKDAEGTIFAGGTNTFGYLDLDSLGRKIYVPINEKFQKSGTIDEIDFYENWVFFLHKNGFYRYNRLTHEVNSITATGTLHEGFELNHEFLFCSAGGIIKLNQEDSVIVVSDQLFVNGAIRNNDGSTWGFSSSSGSFLFNTDGSIIEKELPITRLIKKYALYEAKRLNDQLVAFLFLDQGLIITDNDFNILTHWNASIGLEDQVYDVSVDLSGNLLVTFDDGLLVVNTATPYSIFNESQGLEGLVKDVMESNNKLYAATFKGLYYKDWDDTIQKNASYHRFKKVENSGTYNYDLLAVGEDVLVNAYQSIGVIRYGVYTKLYDKITQSGFVIFSEDSSKVLATGHQGREIIVLEKIRSDWEVVAKINTGDLHSQFSSTSTIFWDSDRKWYWMSTAYGDLYSFRINDAYDKLVDTKAYGESDNLPGKARVRKIDSQFTFLTSGSLYRYDDESALFIPDSRLGIDLVDIYQLEKVEDDFWFASRIDGAGVLQQMQGTFQSTIEFLRPLGASLQVIKGDSNGKILLGGFRGLASLEWGEIATKLNYAPYISRVSLIGPTKDSTVYSTDQSPTFDYQDNSIAFSYSLPSFENSDEVTYSYMLDGFNEEWSSLSDRKVKEYTNLPAGNFTMKVMAINDLGQTSEVATYDFTIKAPWYSTIWAYLLYVLVLALFIWLLIQLNTQRLRLQNEKLESTISERTEEIRQQAEKLKTLDNAKSRFFANVSHELRTPLTLIQGPLESVLGGKEGKITPRVQDQLALSRKSTKKLLRLVEEILDLSKLEAGKLELKPEAVKCYDLISRIFYTYQSSYSGKHLDFQMQYDLPEETIIKVDIGKLEKVLDNLMSNAVKFTRDQGSVKMTVKHTLGQLEISVADTGVGIPPDELAQVFNRFYQSGSGKKYKGGTGIGLALAKELVQLMGGELKVESVEHEGTTFILTIPYQEATTADIPLKVTALPEGAEITENPSEATEIEQDPLLLRNVKILVVEDDPSMRKYIASQLEAYAVDQAEDGLVAIELIEKNNYDLVITDLMMPRLDGMDLVSNLRQSDETKNVSIMMLTARAADEDIVNALTIGVNDYMVKPFNPDELTARVRNILSNRTSRTEAIEQDEQVSFSDQFLNELKAFVLDHLKSSNFNVASLADKAALSERQLNRRIKQATGLTAAAFIREIRLNEARLLLENKTYNTISEVSYATGFETPGYFTTVYTKRFGRKPGNYLNS